MSTPVRKSGDTVNFYGDELTVGEACWMVRAWLDDAQYQLRLVDGVTEDDDVMLYGVINRLEQARELMRVLWQKAEAHTKARHARGGSRGATRCDGSAWE